MKRDQPVLRLLLIAAFAGLAGIALLAFSRVDAAISPSAGGASRELQKILSQANCPCGCTNGLPGGGRPMECFGCSVGKSEASFVREQLAAGRRPLDILMDLNQPVLVEVFADYTDSKLPQSWNRVRAIAAEFEFQRVVLRSTADSSQARRAVQLVECARAANRFSSIRDALIEHPGPWEIDILLDMTAAKGLDRKATQRCLHEIEVTGQIEKDRQHADARLIRSFPAIFVDRERIADSDLAIRLAIRQAMLEKSF